METEQCYIVSNTDAHLRIEVWARSEEEARSKARTCCQLSRLPPGTDVRRTLQYRTAKSDAKRLYLLFAGDYHHTMGGMTDCAHQFLAASDQEAVHMVDMERVERKQWSHLYRVDADKAREVKQWKERREN